MKLDYETVSAEGLVKMFGPTRALAGVDVTLRAGEVLVVEGPNGSGKSTLLALLARLARPTSGVIRYGDHSARDTAALRRSIGVLAHASMVYPDLDARENLTLHARLFGLEDPAAAVESSIERFEIGRFADRPVRTYSRGQLQRVSLARALIATPRLLLLDEPTTGLDVRGVERLVRTVDEERARGAICLLITHDPKVADRLADRRLRLDRGRVVQQEGEAA